MVNVIQLRLPSVNPHGRNIKEITLLDSFGLIFLMEPKWTSEQPEGVDRKLFSLLEFKHLLVEEIIGNSILNSFSGLLFDLSLIRDHYPIIRYYDL